MHGWPTFKEWPSPTALAEEGDYYTGIERAWKAGLRVMVTNLVDNEALCSLMTTRHNPCNDMANVDIQDRDLHALQDYIDAQSGGPGKGWFRLVTDPFQARRVINQGKLAVIEGIEVSRLFGCGESGDVPQCDTSQIDAGIKHVEQLGVRTFFPVHEFDNAFGGTKMIAGAIGTVINVGNREETGSFWTLQPCPAQDQDAEQLSVAPSGPLVDARQRAARLDAPRQPGAGVRLRPAVQHARPDGPRRVPDQADDREPHGDPARSHGLEDRRPPRSRSPTASHYSGVVSAHCCSSPQLFKQVYATGGFVTPPVEPTNAFVVDVEIGHGGAATPRTRSASGGARTRTASPSSPARRTRRSATRSSPTAATSRSAASSGASVRSTSTPMASPTTACTPTGCTRSSSPAATQLMNSMFQGAEAYLEMWERADGVPATRCLPARDRLTRTGIGPIRVGETAKAVLYRAGQPVSRPGHSYTYCISGRRGAPVRAVFDARGRIAKVSVG